MLKLWQHHLKDHAADQVERRGRDPGLGAVDTEEDKSRVLEATLGKIAAWSSPLAARLRGVGNYHPILLNDYLHGISPSMRYDRLQALRLPVATKLYSHVHGGTETLHFMWRLPSKSLRIETDNDRVIMQVKDKLPIYSSRATFTKFRGMLHKLGATGPLKGTAARLLLRDCFGDVTLDNVGTKDRIQRLERLSGLIEATGGDIVVDLER